MRCCRLYRGSREGAVAIVRRRAKPERPSRASPIRLRDALRATLRPFADRPSPSLGVDVILCPNVRCERAGRAGVSAAIFAFPRSL
jgi:hypothetical protein